MSDNGDRLDPQATPLSAEQAAELASLYVVGAMGDDEAARFEARLEAGEKACCDEVSALRGALDEIVGDVVPVAPPPSVRDQLMAQVSGGLEANTFYSQRATEAKWTPTAMPGVSMRLLFEDSARGVRTSLMRIDPGGSVPQHSHPGVEECYVVEGEVFTAGSTFGVGDYIRFDAGSVHVATRSEAGCVLLLSYGIE